MGQKKVLGVSILAALLAACDGGDVSISPSNVDNSVDNSVTEVPTTPVEEFSCATYTKDGVVNEGSFDGTNCTYTTGFVDVDNPITVSMTFPNIGEGVHIFDGSLAIGENHASQAGLDAAGISEGGDGAIVTIEAGVTMAFNTTLDYAVVNRGSQIRANGTAAAPITFTSVNDAVSGTVGAEDVSEWGGMIINGFGVTNKCSYSGTRGVDLALTGECNVVSEGRAGDGETHYGGDNDGDNSGVLRYVVVKHTGAEVAPGNELNGIAFNAVGSGTVVENLQAYSTFDDGIEFFGGAVDVTNYVALYVRDDSIDIDEGYIGTIENALVIQSRLDGNRCVESDGIGSYSSRDQATIDDFIARGLNSAATLKNLTCIVSANETGTHDPGQGMRIREAHFPTISNAIVTTAYSGDDVLGDDDFSYCVRIDNEGQQAALDGNLTISSSIVACQDLVDSSLEGQSTAQWLTDNGNAVYQSAEAGEDPTSASNGDLVILDGFYSVPVASMVATGATIPTPVDSSIIGAVSADNDWTAPWAFGLREGNRSQALWFE
ncbi:serine/threonine protein kinase [Pseudomaricurvus alkylphenolicus]|uniref:serine/threonine protein kinase n=1 Tax=Pseudomaricurvus alkylphenolicus TaxID=1306991 RepID=UPI00141F6F22|nr:serine/threonine protein kinase [Pseudomaricurvus alkylphenolicus]NIB41427.1 serine/threonine protein kinase [Pseudomaricurvus alkylphenolicus]